MRIAAPDTCAVSYSTTSTSIPASRATCSVSPTLATSGDVNVTDGTTRSLARSRELLARRPLPVPARAA